VGKAKSAATTLCSDIMINMPSHKKKIAYKRKLEDYSEVMKHERGSANYFGAFIAKPKNIHVDIQDKDEQIVLVLRQHLITQVKGLFILLVTIFLIPSLLSFAGFFDYLPTQFLTAFYIFWVVLAFGLATHFFLMWFFNVYIVTDERVIDVDFNSMIHRNISSAKIENIEDVSSESIGPLASIFDYGTINLQTAGASNEFEFEHVPQPGKVKKLLNELILEEEREKLEGRVN
jgi:hypothetical protein